MAMVKDVEGMLAKHLYLAKIRRTVKMLLYSDSLIWG